MASEMVLILGPLGDNGPQLYIDGDGRLHSVPPLDQKVETELQAAVSVAMSAEKVGDPELREQAMRLAQQLLASPLSELRQTLDVRSVIQDVLKDSQLQQALRDISDPAQSVALIVAGAERLGHRLTEEGVAQVLAALTCAHTETLSPEELVWVSGGAQAGTITPAWRNHTGKCPHCYML